MIAKVEDRFENLYDACNHAARGDPGIDRQGGFGGQPGYREVFESHA